METVGVGLRAVATLIDLILLCIAGYGIAAMTGSTTAAGFDLVGAPALLWFLVALAYYTVFEAGPGATPGKMALSLRVVMLEGGGKIDWKAALIRNVLRIIDGFAFYLVGAIIIWVSKKRQRLGDMAAGTVVVRAPKS